MALTITIPGAVVATTGATAPATLTIGVGTPGATGPQGPAGAAGQGVPTGGTTGQYLVKSSGTNYDTAWQTLSLAGYATEAWVDSQGYLQSGALTGYLLSSTAASTYQTQAAMSSYLTTSAAASTYAPIAAGQPTSGTIGQVLTKNSGTNYDSSWQTLIPGDRYLSSSTTSLTVGNGTKTLTIGTGLSYSPQQDIVIAYDGTAHMHAVVTTYDSSTGVLVCEVQNHTGSGTYAAWTVNVGGTTPLQSVYWGEILGTLGDQSDLATALNAKLETSTAASTYAALAGATFTGEVATPASTVSSAGFSIAPGTAPTSPTNGEIWNTGSDLQVRIAGVTETLAEQSWVTSQGYLTSSALTPYAPLAGATFTGLVSTPASTTTTAGLRIAHGAAPTTPVNGDVWTTTGGLFARINGGTQQYAPLGSTNTFTGTNTFSGATLSFGTSTAASTINIGTGATIAAATLTINVGTGATVSTGIKAVNIGTNGVAGSTTTVTIGATLGTSTTTLNGTTNATTASADTNTTQIATTAFVVGQAGSATPLVNGTAAVGTSLRYARQDHVHPTDTSRAALASPTFTGVPAAPTAAVDTNTTQLATTAFVVGQASSTAPVIDGTATVGTSLKYARADHVHPTDTSRAPLASPTFTGTPAAPTATAGTNTTQIATTAFVTSAVPTLATDAQVLTGTATTAYIAPGPAGFFKADPRLRQIGPCNGSSISGSGAVTSASGQTYSREMYLGSLAAGRAGFSYGVPGTEAGMITSKANKNQINFSKKIWVAGSCSAGITSSGTNYYGDANSTARVSFGGYSGYATGNMSQKGIGWKKAGGTTTFVNLTVHNGTTLTDVATSFAPVANQAFDWVIYSDGAGNVTLYINGSQAATTSAGPTGTTTSNYNAYYEQVDASVAPTVLHAMHANGGWIYLAD